MATEVILPRVDMDMATGTISRWFAEDGATIEKGAVLFEIETDKAAMEIDAPASGRLHRLAGTDGVPVPVGSVVAWILGAGEAPPLAEPAPDSRTDAVAEIAPPAEPAVSGSPHTGPALIHASGADRAAGSKPRATPLARRLAREGALDLSAIAGSGPRGRIQARDIKDGGKGTPPSVLPSSPHAGEMSAPRPKLGRTEGGSSNTGGGTERGQPLQQRPSAAPGTLNRAWLRQGAGTPLVLLHGFGGELGSWRPLAAACGLDHPILALDLPGHGSSPAGASAFEDIVAAVGEALAEEGVDQAHLVGHSLGAAVAAALADGGAVGARSLFLVSPAGLGPEIDAAFLSGLSRARSQASLAPWMRMLVHDPAALLSSFVAATARTRASEGVVEAQARLAEAVFPDATQIFSVREALARTSVPVRIVFGLADRIIPAHHTAGLPGMVALHLFPEVGHMPHVEARDAVVRLLAQHIASAERA